MFYLIVLFQSTIFNSLLRSRITMRNSLKYKIDHCLSLEECKNLTAMVAVPIQNTTEKDSFCKYINNAKKEENRNLINKQIKQFSGQNGIKKWSPKNISVVSVGGEVCFGWFWLSVVHATLFASVRGKDKFLFVH